MGYKVNPITGELMPVGVTEQELAAELYRERGEIQTSLSQELQAAVQRVEGTASVATTVAATLPAGSTGPVAVSMADPEFLGAGTSIKGLLGTVYGVLTRAANGSYSFTSEQTYIGSVALGAGTIFAAAHLPNSLNPLRIGDAELQEDVSYADTGYVYVMLDADGRVAWGVKADGAFVAEKISGTFSGSFAGIFTGHLTGNVTGNLTGNVTGDVDADEIRVNKLIAPGGTIDLDSADTQLLNILEGGAQTGDASYADTYSHVLVDANDRLAYGVLPDGSVVFGKSIALGGNEFGPDNAYDFYAYVEADSAGRISRVVRLTGEQYIPKAEIDQLTVKSLNIAGSTAGFRSDSLGGGLLGLFESRTNGTNHQIYRYYKGIESQLTTQGDNFGISLTDESEKRILFYTTRNDALGTGVSEPYVMDVDGGRQVPALGTSDITLWGDSMSGTFGVSTTQQSFIDAGETNYSRVFRNQGSGGLSSVVIAMQMGAAGWTVEVPGGQINASGNTTVNNIRAAIYTDFATEKGLNLDPFEYSNFIAKMPRQRVGGVIGKIKRQTASSVTTTATGSADAPTIAVADATGITVGMLVKQTDGNEDKIILGTTVTSISGTTLTLSASNVSALSSVSLDFYVNSGYYFERETAGDAVIANGPQKVVPITNNGFGTDQGYPQTDMEDLLNSIQILWPFGPHGSGGDDPARMEMIVLDAMVNQGLTALSKKYVMLNAIASSTKAITNINDYGTVVKTTDAVEQAYIDNYGDRYLSIIDTALNGNSSLSISSFKAWFNTNYSTIYSSATSPYAWDGLGANASFRQTTTSGVTAVTLVDAGTSGTQSTTSVDTTTTGSGVALRLGVVASGGVATAIWVREPGHGYAASDTVTIAAGTIGNSAAITATVGSIGNSSPGNDVFNQDGTVDTASAYNEWDIDNGYMPRAMFTDSVHLSSYGKEFVRLMVAKYILNQGW